MRRLRARGRAVAWVLFAALAGCGHGGSAGAGRAGVEAARAPERRVVEDGGVSSATTPGVAVDTASRCEAHPDDVASLAPEGTAPGALEAGRVKVAFSPRARWVVFASEDGSYRTFVDLGAGGASITLREPLWLREEGGERADLVSEGELAEGTTEPPWFSPDERYVVGRGVGEAGVRLISLATGDAVFARRGPVSGLSFSPDGRFLAWVEPGCAVHFLELGTKRHREVAAPGSDGPLAWSARGNRVAWREGAEGAPARLRAVDPASEREAQTVSPPDGDVGTVLLSEDGGWALVYSGVDAFTVWRLGDRTPRVTVRAPQDGMAEARWSSRGATLLWSEHLREGVSDDLQGRTRFHVVDLEGGGERVFAGRVSCWVEYESARSFDGAELITSGSCSLGCPSEPYQEVLEVYDVLSGRHVATRTGAVEPSYHDRSERLLSDVRRRADRNAMGLAALVLAGDRELLVRRGGGLSRVQGRTGRVLARLVDSGLQAPDRVRHSPSAGVFAGVDGAGRARVWEAATGALRWTDP